VSALALTAAGGGGSVLARHSLHDHKLRIFDLRTQEDALKEVLLPVGALGDGGTLHAFDTIETTAAPAHACRRPRPAGPGAAARRLRGDA